MKNLLLLIPLLICGQVYAQPYKPVPYQEQLKKEALAITPARSWVKSLDNSNWYYGYKVGNDFRYARMRQDHALSDLSSTYPLSYRFGKMRDLPRLNFVYESYDQQFTNTNKIKIKPTVIPLWVAKDYKLNSVTGKYVKKTDIGFDWIDKPRHQREGDWDWNKKK